MGVLKVSIGGRRLAIENMRVFLILAAVLAGLTAIPSNAQATQIYLLRGFAGIFSLGLDTLAKELAARGYHGTLHSYDEASTLAVQAARLEKRGRGPIIIIGHSLGADDAISMAKQMKQEGARVALVVTFGPDYSQKVPSNVSRVLNFYQEGARMRRGPGFRGVIRNVDANNDPGVDHFNIEKIHRFHMKTIAAIERIARPSRRIAHRRRHHAVRSAGRHKPVVRARNCAAKGSKSCRKQAYTEVGAK